MPRYGNSTKRDVHFRVRACFWLIFLIPSAGPASAQISTTYAGDLELPMPLYTRDGTRLEKGKFQIEIRLEKGRHFLAFLRNRQLVSLVDEQPANSAEGSAQLPDLPIIGTVYLRSAGTPLAKEEKATVTFAEHLGSRPWKADIRVYRYSDPQKNEVYFLLEEELKPGEWSRTQFKLFLHKLA